ncbi:MAG: DUF1269 domain-containing family protein [Lactobacillus sp.]|jgi:gas vesicle protein|nr:DUF1269 domain-containing family protein [Lactobacillus sp.]
MKKTGSFILGTLFGAGVSLLATSILASDDNSQKLKDTLAKNETLANLKKKYDNGTELLKNQLTSFPKTVEDNSEIKDFDDIVIDKTDHKPNHEKDDAEGTMSDLENQED